MAGDGMVINFELGDGPFTTAPAKLKGGRWRERVRANKYMKSGENPRALPRHSERPNKRLRLNDDDSDISSHPSTRPYREEPTRKLTRKTNTSNTNSAPPTVTSRLFTANPTPITDFDKASTADFNPETMPSNAPLSEEAATFHVLGLAKRLSHHLSSKLDMKAPTSIQKNTIPQLVSEDSDAFLQAETGSGKTLAYLLPIVQRILALSQHQDGATRNRKINRSSGLFAIILAPTRELCKQIATVLEKVLRCSPWIVSTTVIGGESKKSEKARLRKGANILIATPGRLADHLDHTKVLDVGTVRWLVLDEGDRLMEMGFEEELRTIVAKIRKEVLLNKNKEDIELDTLPKRRVTILCSATMKMNVQKLGEISLVDAIYVTASNSNVGKEVKNVESKAGNGIFTAPSQLKQTSIIVPAKLRLVTLISFLKSVFERKGSVMKAIIFISCADSVDFYYDLLRRTQPPTNGEESTDKIKMQRLHLSNTTSHAAYITSPANPVIHLIKLHGSLPQPVRTATLQAFSKTKEPAVLVTTDIASRGLDVPAVDLVVEYDPAFAVPDHVHRIGRTARAGRPGKAVLFLQPGCEEGYASFLQEPQASESSSFSAPPSRITAQPYDSILQKGLARPVTNYPDITASTAVSEVASAKQTWSTRAEALQLHLEQRLLDPKATPLLDAARRAFRSHIRAYATHVRDERCFFDITQLHLGHVAKAFGLREPPSGIGGGITRRSGAHQKVSFPSNAAAENEKNGGWRRNRGNEYDGDNYGGLSVDGDTVRRMKEKMKAVTMNVADEFNIG